MVQRGASKAKASLSTPLDVGPTQPQPNSIHKHYAFFRSFRAVKQAVGHRHERTGLAWPNEHDAGAVQWVAGLAHSPFFFLFCNVLFPQGHGWVGMMGHTLWIPAFFFFFSFRRCSVRASRSSVEYAAIFLVSSIPTVFLGSYYLHAWIGGGGGFA